MIKIIKIGRDYSGEIVRFKCPVCHTEFEADGEDYHIYEDDWCTVYAICKCPICRNEITRTIS